MKRYLDALVQYAVDRNLICDDDRVFAYNRLLFALGLDEAEDDGAYVDAPLHEVLEALCDEACRRGLIDDNNVARDLVDTELMGLLTPFPHEVRGRFAALYAESPERATDWYYRFCQDTNYIRRDRIAKDLKWVYDSEYGALDITVNLSKPEKDPRAIAAAGRAAPAGYPLCQLCEENEGYAGRIDHPARQNHRPIPLQLDGADWFFQYSPYVYYNEHCIVFNRQHTPMRVDAGSFRRLLDFVARFPHYFVGSNADLPIVGGSILSHDHFQGGRYDFAMAKAPIETALAFPGYADVQAGIVRWPMSVLRLRSAEPTRLAALADTILRVWRGYTDESVSLYAQTDGTPHSTVTPIARRRGADYEMDLVLRNNLTTDEHPLGLFHPHAALHHIKKENIGLIEVMGLAVLPARLKTELDALAHALTEQRDLRADPALAKHADWADEILSRHTLSADNIQQILRDEVGLVFQHVLEDAGVFKRDETGQTAFLRFAEAVKRAL